MTGIDWQKAYEQFSDLPADFWGRRESAPMHRRSAHIFGRPVLLESNDPGVPAALDASLPLYSTLPPRPEPPFRVQIVVQSPRADPGPPPPDLMDRLWYSGDAGWLMIHAGGWGHVFADLPAGEARMVICPALARLPELLSRVLLNTVLLNFFLGNGYGMLHASSLERDGGLLLLMAPHNTGKSTTALRLLEAGFRLVTDSMIHIVPDVEPLTLAAFPVGLGKLRADMTAAFPHLHPIMQPEIVRDETKHALNLRRLDPRLVVETGISPRRVLLCLLERDGGPETRRQSLAPDALRRAIIENSLYHDTPAVWARNLAQIDRLLAQAECARLIIGSDPAGIIATVEEMWDRLLP